MVTHGDNASHGAGRCSDSCMWFPQVQGIQRQGWQPDFDLLVPAGCTLGLPHHVSGNGHWASPGGMGQGWGGDVLTPCPPLLPARGFIRHVVICLVPNVSKLTEVRVKHC